MGIAHSRVPSPRSGSTPNASIQFGHTTADRARTPATTASRYSRQARRDGGRECSKTHHPLKDFQILLSQRLRRKSGAGRPGRRRVSWRRPQRTSTLVRAGPVLMLITHGTRSRGTSLRARHPRWLLRREGGRLGPLRIAHLGEQFVNGAGEAVEPFLFAAMPGPVNLFPVRYQEDAADITAGASAWRVFLGHDSMVRVAPRTVNGSKPREVRGCPSPVNPSSRQRPASQPHTDRGLPNRGFRAGP